MALQDVMTTPKPSNHNPAFDFGKTGLSGVLSEYLAEKRDHYAELAEVAGEGMISPERASEFLAASYGSMNAAEREEVYRFLVLDRCSESGTLTPSQQSSYLRARERVSEILRHLIAS